MERSVVGFAKDRNEAVKKELRDKLHRFKDEVTDEEADRMELFASMDIFNRHSQGKKEDPDDGEFEDLGKSVRLKSIESEFQDALVEARSRHSEESRSCERTFLAVKEKEWFSFLDE